MNLPKFSAGEEIEYTLEETAITGFTPTYSKDGLTVTNTQDTTEVPVEKKWKNADGSETWPAGVTVTVNLLADGESTGKAVTLSASKPKDTFKDLPVYKYEDGQASEIAYTVEEPPVISGGGVYKSEISGSAEEGFTITNTQVTVTIEIPVIKTITKTNAPRGEVTFKFELTGSDPLPDTTELEISLEGSQKGSADGSFGSVKFEKPGTYTYTISETELPKGWSADGAKSGTVTITVTDNGKGALEATIDPEIVEIKNQYQHRDHVPKTDDNTNLDKWGIGAAISLAGFAGVEVIDAIVKKRKKEDEAK